MKFSCSTASWILLHPAIGLDNALCTAASPLRCLIGQCMAHSRVPVSRLVIPVCRPLSLFDSGFTSSTSILSLSLHLIAFYLNLTPSISLSPSLPFSSLPPILSTPTSPPTLSPRVQTAISRHSSTSRQLGPIRGGALTPASFDSRSSTC